jgi:hypothetical protein
MSAEEQKSDPTPEELREEIRETREELGDTVEAITGKADAKVEEAKRRVPVVAGALVVLALLIWLIRRD